MESARTSCVNNFLVESEEATNEDSAQEESGWTTYLEDFSMDQRENRSCDTEDDNSLLSDAAWKNCNSSSQVIMNEYSPMGGSPLLKRLNMKKKPRNKKLSDPDLEDTASSPVNSPKGNQGSSRQFQEMQRMERGSISYDNNNGYTDLKKKGLCLVPLSMFVNYQG